MSALDDRRYVCLLNGSLRGERASSQHFLQRVDAGLARRGWCVTSLGVEPGAAHVYPSHVLSVLHGADAVVLASPLYGYCLPGGLMRLLEAWAEFARAHPRQRPARLYAIINCGFVVPATIAEAIAVVRHFCARAGLEYRFALAIACGPVAVVTEPIDPRLRRAYRQLVEDIHAGPHAPASDIYLEPLVPRLLLDLVRETLDARVRRDIARRARSLQQVHRPAVPP